MDNRVSLVEEEIIVNKFLSEDVANVTGAAVSTDEPKISSNAAKKYKKGNGTVVTGMTRRSMVK
jgi:hypothetical protein